MIVLIIYISFIKPFLDNKMSIFEEYGAFKVRLKGGSLTWVYLYNIWCGCFLETSCSRSVSEWPITYVFCEEIRKVSVHFGWKKMTYPLRKHAYSNILKILPPKKWKFSDKKIWFFFHVSAQNIDCGYSLEPPHLSAQHRLWVLIRTASMRKKKNNVYPCKPQFYYIKV